MGAPRASRWALKPNATYGYTISNAGDWQELAFERKELAGDEKFFDMLARQRRGNQHRRVIEKEKPFARGIDNFVDGVSYAVLWLNEIEFVCHKNRRLTCLLD